MTNLENNKHSSSFRSFLKNELARRCAKNPSYSLRSFAKLLGVSHTTLSQVISGKRPLTLKAQKQMALALALSPEQFVSFQMPGDITFDEQFEPLNIKKYDILADWIHDAILELTHLKSFKPDPKWMAVVLDVNVHEVNAAIDRLVQAGLLKVGRSRWKDLSANNTINHLGDFTNPALKKYQKDILEKSMVALESLPREERDHTSLMLNFSAKNIKEAKQMIKEFRTKFSVKTKLKSKDADNVFALNISFFPISKIIPNIKKNKPKEQK